MTQQEKKAARSFAGIAGIVAAATLISKVFGLIRQQAVAAAFGVGGKSEVPADLQAYFKKMGKVAGKEHIADAATSAGIDIEELTCTRQIELVYQGLLSGDLKLV